MGYNVISISITTATPILVHHNFENREQCDRWQHMEPKVIIIALGIDDKYAAQLMGMTVAEALAATCFQASSIALALQLCFYRILRLGVQRQDLLPELSRAMAKRLKH